MGEEEKARESPKLALGSEAGRGGCLFVQVPGRAGAERFERPGDCRTPASGRDAGNRDLAPPQARLRRVSGRGPSSPLPGFSERVGRCPRGLPLTWPRCRIFLEPLPGGCTGVSAEEPVLGCSGEGGLGGPSCLDSLPRHRGAGGGQGGVGGSSYSLGHLWVPATGLEWSPPHPPCAGPSPPISQF